MRYICIIPTTAEFRRRRSKRAIHPRAAHTQTHECLKYACLQGSNPAVVLLGPPEIPDPSQNQRPVGAKPGGGKRQKNKREENECNLRGETIDETEVNYPSCQTCGEGVNITVWRLVFCVEIGADFAIASGRRQASKRTTTPANRVSFFHAPPDQGAPRRPSGTPSKAAPRPSSFSRKRKSGNTAHGKNYTLPRDWAPRNGST